MSGSITAANGSATLLDAIYGINTSTAGSGGDPVQALTYAENNQTQQVAQTAKQPAVQRDVTAFTNGVNAAKSVTQLLANPAVMKVLLTANGLSDQIGYTALATKVLTSNLSDPNSLANTLTDPRWKAMATAYNFAANGLSTIQSSSAVATIAQSYAKATWETAQDTTTPGLANALTFKQTASTITTVDQILGDPTMRTVITTTLGIPEQIAFQPLEAQEKAISSQVDITQFQDPKFVESFVQRYLIANSQANASSASSPDMMTLAVQGQGLLA